MTCGVVTTTVLDQVNLDFVTIAWIHNVPNTEAEGVNPQGKLSEVILVSNLFERHVCVGQELLVWSLAPIMQMSVMFQGEARTTTICPFECGDLVRR